MTNDQKMFAAGKRLIKSYEKTREKKREELKGMRRIRKPSDEMTEEEKAEHDARIKVLNEITALTNEIENVKSTLYAFVGNFGMKQASKRMAKYRLSADAKSDIRQDLAAIFYERLPYYNPARVTPSTYFLRYFNQVISEYVLKYSQNLSQYDAHNVSIVRAAKKKLAAEGRQWDERILVDMTGLSPKVVKNTLRIEMNSIMGNIDDAINVASKTPTPEEYYIKDEQTRIIAKALRDTLDDDDLAFFLSRFDEDDGGREKSYQQMSEELGIPVRDIKQRWNSIITRLNENKELQDYNHYRRHSGASVNLQPQSLSSQDEILIFSSLSDIPLHNAEEDEESENDDLL